MDILKIRRDTAANWASEDPILGIGEFGYDTTNAQVKLGDGVTAWSSLALYAEGASSGFTSSDIGSAIQAYDANLAAISSITPSEDAFIVANGSTFVKASTTTAQNYLGYGTLAAQSTFAPTDLGETLAVAKGGTGSTTAAGARTALGLVIDTDVESYNANVSTDANIGSTIQAYDSNLTSFVSTFTLPTVDGTASYGVKTDGAANIGFAEAAAGLAVANTVDDLPENPSTGAVAYVVDEDTFYVWNGSAWRYFTLSEYSSGTAWVFQGSNYGYTSGGKFPYSNIVDKFSFSTDGNATDVGDLTVARALAAGQSSTTHGYTSGGAPSGTDVTNIIDKFPFSTDGNATDVGDLTVARSYTAGQSSTTHGYTSGGADYLVVNRNTIDKFPFSTDANATDIANLTADKSSIAGQSSTTHGYTSGGSDPSGIINVIDKFPFSTDGNATDVGDLTLARAYPTGQSSATYGYNSGGTRSPGPVTPYYTNIIDKFPFATDTNATDVGDLTVGRSRSAGQSSTTNGYISGGAEPAYSNIVDKFSFSTDANATDVGDLTVIRDGAAGQQY